MSRRYESRQAIANKIDWEGGLESFLDYGFDDQDVPEGDDELAIAARCMLEDWREYQKSAEKFDALLPEPGGE